MNLDTRVGAFVEYVLRPLTEDIRQILEQLRALNIGITQQTVKDVTLTLGLWHLAGEVIRALSYIVIVWLVCRVVQSVW